MMTRVYSHDRLRLPSLAVDCCIHGSKKCLWISVHKWTVRSPHSPSPAIYCQAAATHAVMNDDRQTDGQAQLSPVRRWYSFSFHLILITLTQASPTSSPLCSRFPPVDVFSHQKSNFLKHTTHHSVPLTWHSTLVYFWWTSYLFPSKLITFAILT